MARETRINEEYSKRAHARANYGEDRRTGEEEICAGGVVFFNGRIVALRRKNGVWQMPKG
ncbi:MAG: hypothetical protein GX085_10235, partial [Firmicutes bacterium]|nr:hypothetical protein [Bacillota bacterium]